MAQAKPAGGSAKRAKKVVEAEGIAHVTATFNNTLITITDMQGNAITWGSSGLAGGAPRDGVALHVGDRDERVVERRRDVSDALGLDDLLGALRASPCRLRLCHLLFEHGLFLARYGAPRPLLGARVGVGALAAHRQSLAVPRPAVRPDVHQSLDVHRHLGPQRALDLVVPLNHLPQACHLGVAQVAHSRVRTDPRLGENLLRVRGSDAEDIRKGVLDFLVARQIHARNTCHSLPLPLLVLGAALADDADDASPLDHLAVLADRSNAGANLQRGRLREKNPIESRTIDDLVSSRKGPN